MNIQNEYREGHMSGQSSDNPYLWSSTSWEAFELGVWMRRSGRDYTLVRKSRGSSFKTARGALYFGKYMPDHKLAFSF